MQKIYLDHAATTPLSDEALKEMEPFFKEKFGNPSSVHCFGQEAVFAVDEARKKVAHFLDSKEREIIFTSSATEANNLAILGSVSDKKDHIITSAFEHEAVLEPCKACRSKVSYLPVYKEGVVRVSDVIKEIREETVLISLMYVNSEIGTIQPISEIGMAVEKINKTRKRKIIFHADAVQAANYLPCRVDEMKVDLLTLSGHKIYGPKGVGVLYVREGTDLSSIMYGAPQERGIRPGTENVPAIVGFGKAVEQIDIRKSDRVRIMRDSLIERVTSSIEGVSLNGSREKRVPNNINLAFQGVEGESLVIALDMEGIAVSTGSACASRSLSPSHVLISIGLSHRLAHGSLRITLGNNTTEEELNSLLEKLPPIVEKLRKISGR